MTIRLIVVGKTDMLFVRDGFELYRSRLKHYVNFSYEEIPALKDQKGASPTLIKQREGALILKTIQREPADKVILLDEHGKSFTSVDFSEYLQKQMNSASRSIVFVVGGAYGFSDEVYAAATDKISLSPMTFNHQMVRLFFAEQLYRAFTILKHEPYHNE
jgi:23S rRNA (pseudouridine1915-N3)-methyltransferase